MSRSMDMYVRYRKILPYPPVKVSTEAIMKVCFSILEHGMLLKNMS